MMTKQEQIDRLRRRIAELEMKIDTEEWRKAAESEPNNYELGFAAAQEAKIVAEKRWLKAKARIAELEAALEGDAGNVIHFAEQQALDRAERAALSWCVLVTRVCIEGKEEVCPACLAAAAIRKLKDQ
jgi:hypothetical protein